MIFLDCISKLFSSLFATFVTVYIWHKLLNIKINLRSKKTIIFSILFAIIIYIIFLFLLDNDIFRSLTIERFSEDGIRSERIELSKLAKTYFLQNKKLMMK